MRQTIIKRNEQTTHQTVITLGRTKEKYDERVMGEKACFLETSPKKENTSLLGLKERHREKTASTRALR